MAAKVEIFDDWQEVARRFGAAAESDLPLFQRPSWFRLIAEHAPPVGSLLALCSGYSTWLFLTRQGSRASAYANWYSLRFSAVGTDERGLAPIARTLRTMKPKLSRVELAPLAPGDPLPHAFRQAGWITLVEPATANWQIDCAGLDFDAYWASRPSRLRNTVRRKAKAACLEVRIHTRFDPAAWADYERVYAGSWKPAEGSPAMLRALAEQQGAAGTLRLGLAYKDGAPIAAQLWLVEGGTATIHKLAYDEAAKELSPGSILSADMFRHALDTDKVDRIDFGTGNDGYKAEWMGQCVTLERLVAFNPGTIAGLAGAARGAASKLVRRARSH